MLPERNFFGPIDAVFPGCQHAKLSQRNCLPIMTTSLLAIEGEQFSRPLAKNTTPKCFAIRAVKKLHIDHTVGWWLIYAVVSKYKANSAGSGQSADDTREKSLAFTYHDHLASNFRLYSFSLLRNTACVLS